MLLRGRRLINLCRGYTRDATALESVRNSQGKYYQLRKTNERFEEYYKRFIPKEEWDRAFEYMRKPLPLAFRLVPSAPSREFLRSLFQEEFGVGVQQVPWYEPYGNAFQVPELHRWDLQDNSKLGRHILRERSLGHLYRQELVSMVPVHFLDIKPHHKVLDMCASPGSKTTQALEYLDEEKGFVIANEFDSTRVFKLISNLKQFSHSHSHLTVNEDGRYFPDISINGSILQYDRIICDVPCCGDGTIRKNPNVWLNWHPNRGNSRHHIQYAIAARGIQLLKPGGIMVYSSCAMNPVENEAVISRLLKDFQGDICVKEPPVKVGLNYSQGLRDWEVFDMNMNAFRDYSLAVGNVQIAPQLFPPKEVWIQEELTKTMRFQPHHNNDGGFFVAYIQKKESTSEKIPTFQVPMPMKESKIAKYAIKIDPRKVQNTLQHFGIDLSVASTFFHYNNFTCDKKIHSTSKGLLELCDLNPSLNIVGLGNLVLKREFKFTSPVEYRFPNASVHGYLQNKISKGLIHIPLRDFKRLIQNETLEISENLFTTDTPGPVKFIVREDECNKVLESCLGYIGKLKVGLNISPSYREHLKFKYNIPL